MTPYSPTAASRSASTPKNPESIAITRSCVSSASTSPDSDRKVNIHSGLIAPTVLATSFWRSAGNPLTARTLKLSPCSSSDICRMSAPKFLSTCARGMYTTGGGSSRSDEDAMSATTPTISTGGPGVSVESVIVRPSGLTP